MSFERFATWLISFMQRGFLKGRQILDNVLDIDHASHTLSIISQQAALLLFDFRAAFPSVSHDVLWILLKIAGLPAPFVRLIRSLYKDCRHLMRVHGKRFNGPVLKSGVRQGCPLSGLLFAIVTEPVIRLLARSLEPRGSLRAYADDLGACVANYVLAPPLLGRVFLRIAAGTGII